MAANIQVNQWDYSFISQDAIENVKNSVLTPLITTQYAEKQQTFGTTDNGVLQEENNYYLHNDVYISPISTVNVYKNIEDSVGYFKNSIQKHIPDGVLAQVGKLNKIEVFGDTSLWHRWICATVNYVDNMQKGGR